MLICYILTSLLITNGSEMRSALSQHLRTDTMDIPLFGKIGDWLLHQILAAIWGTPEVKQQGHITIHIPETW